MPLYVIRFIDNPEAILFVCIFLVYEFNIYEKCNILDHTYNSISFSHLYPALNNTAKWH